MGWDFCEAWQSRVDVMKAILEDLRNVKILASAGSVSSRFWIAIEETAKEQPQRIVLLALLRRSGGSWGYKLMDEGMGIFETDVPRRVFEAVKDSAPFNAYSKTWREQVEAGAKKAHYAIAV